MKKIVLTSNNIVSADQSLASTWANSEKIPMIINTLNIVNDPRIEKVFKDSELEADYRIKGEININDLYKVVGINESDTQENKIKHIQEKILNIFPELYFAYMNVNNLNDIITLKGLTSPERIIYNYLLTGNEVLKNIIRYINV